MRKVINSVSLLSWLRMMIHPLFHSLPLPLCSFTFSFFHSLVWVFFLPMEEKFCDNRCIFRLLPFPFEERERGKGSIVSSAHKNWSKDRFILLSSPFHFSSFLPLSLSFSLLLRMWEMMRLVRIEEDTHVKHEREECVFNHRIDDQFHFTPFLPFSSFQLSFFSSSFCSSLLLKNEKTRERERESWKYHVMFFVFKSLIFLHIMLIWKMVGYMMKRDLVQPTRIWTYKKILLELSHSHSVEVRTGNEKQDGRKDGTKRKELEIDTEKGRLCTLGTKKKRERGKERRKERKRRRSNREVDRIH